MMKCQVLRLCKRTAVVVMAHIPTGITGKVCWKCACDLNWFPEKSWKYLRDIGRKKPQ